MPAAGGVIEVSLTAILIVDAPLFNASVSVSVPSVNRSAANVIVTVGDTPTTKDPCKGIFISLAVTPVIVYAITVPFDTFPVASVNDAEFPSLTDDADLDKL